MARRQAEIFGHAADQKTRSPARAFQDPGQDRARGGLAVGAGDREHMPVAQDLAVQPFRPGDIVQPLVQRVFQRRVAARERVANDQLIRRGLQLPGGVAGRDVDPGGGQLRAHRRIDIFIRAAHRMAQTFRDLREAAHEDAADAQDMQAHQYILTGSRVRVR